MNDYGPPISSKLMRQILTLRNRISDILMIDASDQNLENVLEWWLESLDVNIDEGEVGEYELREAVYPGTAGHRKTIGECMKMDEDEMGKMIDEAGGQP